MTTETHVDPEIEGFVPQGTRTGGKSSPAKANQLERERKAVELRKRGATFEEIARVVGYKSRTGAKAAVDRALKKEQDLASVDARELRALELEKLAMMEVGIHKKQEYGSPEWVASLERVLKHRERLLGLAANEERQARAAEVAAGVQAAQAQVLVEVLGAVTEALGLSLSQKARVPGLVLGELRERGLLE